VVISTVARGEILFGLARLAPGRRREELQEKANRLFAVIPTEALPPAAGDQYASLKLSQQQRGVPLDENDLWIAANAVAIDATLVSCDSDFQRIAGLAVVKP
jgi:tRNA(fMet)-specific endonuclease VapC